VTEEAVMNTRRKLTERRLAFKLGTGTKTHDEYEINVQRNEINYKGANAQKQMLNSCDD
jgi:hypothetical protein